MDQGHCDWCVSAQHDASISFFFLWSDDCKQAHLGRPSRVVQDRLKRKVQVNDDDHAIKACSARGG